MMKKSIFLMLAAAAALLFASCTQTLPLRMNAFVAGVEKNADTYTEEDWDQANEKFQALCDEYQENKGSLSTLIALYKPFNNRLLIDTRDPGCIDWYDLVLEGLQQRYPDNPHTLHFKNTTEHLRSALKRNEE